MTTDAKPLTKDEIEELERLEREATPGEWGVLIAPESHGRWREIYADGPQRVAVLSRANADINGAFIAALRNAAPSLLSSARAHASALARAEEAERAFASLRERVRALAEEWHVQREAFAEADEDDCCAAVIGTFVGELRALLAPTKETTPADESEAQDCTCIAPNPSCPNCNGTGRYQP